METRINDIAPGKTDSIDSSAPNSSFLSQMSCSLDENDTTSTDSASTSFVEFKADTSAIYNHKNGDVRALAVHKRLPGLNDTVTATDLLSLLSGNSKSSLLELLPQIASSQVEDLTEEDDNLDSSFTELKSIECRKDHDLLQLEKKFFPTAKTISSKDIFSRFKQDKKPVVKALPTEPIHISDDEDEATSSLESKIFGSNAKRTNISSLLRPVLKKKQLLVTLKIDRSVLLEIKKNDNPFKVKGNTGGIASGKSIFTTMMRSQANVVVKKTPLQKLKELNPDPLLRYQFHVFTGDLPHSNEYLALMSKRTPTSYDIDGTFTFIPNNKTVLNKHTISSQIHDDILTLIHQTIPNLDSYPALVSIVERFIKNDNGRDSCLWTNKFQPESTQGLLMSNENISTIKNWINNSFARLQANHLKQPRNVLLQQRKKRNQQKPILDGFIVDDSFDTYGESSETEEDIFMPILLIQGSTGSCKSTSIYTAMKEDNGYIHEINTGGHRGRKDIYNSLKEFCTTQLVHKQSESKTFQKGLVLLEDVNILFEQDKSFWQVVQDILNISRRPIVLTCEDFIGIPKSIFEHAEEENSIVYLDNKRIPQRLLCNYLWLCALSQGYNIDEASILDIVTSSYNGHNYDLRKCLMECQIICQAYNKPQHGQLTYISMSVKEPPQLIEDLQLYLTQMDLLSSADVISSNSFSLLSHETLTNEFSDVYMIDESTNLRQPALPYELNVGIEISEMVNQQYQMDIYQPTTQFTYNEVRNSTLEFLGSRSKKLPKFIQDMNPYRRSTRSQTPIDDLSSDSIYKSWTPETIGPSEVSFINNMSPSLLLLDLLPYTGYWLSYQIFLDRLEEKCILEGSEFMKPITYRDFQNKASDIFRYLPLKHNN